MALKGKNIVVTGSSRGIGREIALMAARKGARVGINYLRFKESAAALASTIAGEGLLEPVMLPFDATRVSDIEPAIEFFLEKTGKLDGWVNNAAVNIPGLLPVLSEEEIRAQLDSALLGPILCCRAVIPRMLENGCGSIVNIGSIVTERTFRGQSVYAAGKGGLAAFSRALAMEFGRKGIRVNCLQPGPVETGMMEAAKKLSKDEIGKKIPLGKYISPADVASLAVFLLSDASSSMTGAVVNIDGGFSL